MLKFLRKKTKIIVWTVVVCFVAWGGYAVGTQFQESNRAPGRIFGKEVSFRDYLAAGEAVQLFSPAAKEENPPTADEIEARTWQFLILSSEAKRRKINVSDEELRDEISRLLTDKNGVSLNGEQYLQWIRTSFHLEPREFEKAVREHLRIRRLLDQVKAGFKENPDEAVKPWLAELMVRSKLQVYRRESEPS